ncbi:histidine kinase [Paenibacillus sp. N3/727]|uniref:sensor histidine kinase n=1 Tax=Paenibacillus sp. N3/727 TaxID=2925845 RepID=UPI001F53D22D|nr:sensor histidine kinase [Paenibacillus sp. N3/727]UNK19464.1 histidine kinase [Paenibacillus sp. N3/727]
MHSIQRKITLYAGGCFLLLFLALLGSIYIEMERTVVPLNESLTQQIVNARSEQISYWFQQRIGEVEMLATLASDHHWTREELLRESRKLEQRRGHDYESIRIVDLKGNSWTPDSKSFSILTRDYYKELISSDAPYVVSNVIVSRANEAEIVVILYRVGPLVNEDTAYIAAAVPIGKMKEIAQDILVYDGRGWLIVNSEFPELEDSRANMATFTASIAGVPGWKLIFQVPKSQLTQGMTKTQRSALMVGTVVGIFFLILVLLLGSSIAKPIQALRQLMRQVEDGDWSVRSNDKRRDEIGELGRSFNQMLIKLYQSQQEKKELELQMIHEQIKPHFLYNTLDTIQWMAASHDAHDVVDIVESLSTYFRLGLSSGSQFVTLEQEFQHVESYLNIQCVRYDDILDYELSYDKHLEQQQIIRFILQPLVENAIYHGIKPLTNQKSKISIRAYERGDQLIVTAQNNGVDIPKSRLASLQETLRNGKKDRNEEIGFGLYSVSHRIKLAYGELYGLQISSGQGITCMTINIPLGGDKSCGKS